jgi:sirohydrochlorin ferrochelatase
MSRAIIIVDHGSTRPAANRMLEDVAALVRRRTSDPVYAAHMELVEPTVEAAFEAAVEAGADLVFVFPYFLSPGRHSREDIPRMCARAAARHPGVVWHCCGPIGLDPLMADLIVQRVGECAAQGMKCERCPDAEFCKQNGNGGAQ